ncbi:MAG: DinB family protein [Candidatus Thorarchaeota archaeon]|nr:MAG: DinB family protein [Candidatus Thorarchaeota archaeon]
MKDVELFKLAADSTRKWREMEIRLLEETGCKDLSYRPRTGMASLGWVLAHQASIYDFSLNMLIKAGPPMNPTLFKLYTPGTSGDWVGTSKDEIQNYYDSGERDFLNWIEGASESDLERRIEKGNAPSFFVGMTVREVIASAFTHLDYHTGHLTAIRKDWEKSRQ